MTAFSAMVLAKPDDISALTGQLLAFLEEQQVEPRTAHHVGLVVDELLMNLGTHGACPDRPAKLTITVEPGQVRGEVVDTGAAFDPRDTSDPDLAQPAADRPVGGLGLFLVRQFTSTLEYARRNGENCTTFTIARS